MLWPIVCKTLIEWCLMHENEWWTWKPFKTIHCKSLTNKNVNCSADTKGTTVIVAVTVQWTWTLNTMNEREETEWNGTIVNGRDAKWIFKWSGKSYSLQESCSYTNMRYVQLWWCLWWSSLHVTITIIIIVHNYYDNKTISVSRNCVVVPYRPLLFLLCFDFLFCCRSTTTENDHGVYSLQSTIEIG